MRQWARDVQRFADDWPAQGAEVLAAVVDAQLRADTGGDGAFSRDTAGRADVDTTTGRGEADVVGAGAMGVWAILEHGTGGHEVRARRGRVLATPYGPRPVVRVSGVRPRRTWSRGVERGMQAVERDATAAWGRVGA